MFQNSATILRLFGIEIKLAPSWVLIAALITWSFADRIFPATIPGLRDNHYLLLGGAAMLLFFASLVLHELAHALVAQGFGIKVPRITLFLFGGVAELGQEPDTASHEFWIAIAGPLMSLTLASMFWAMSLFLSVIDAGQAGQTVLQVMASLNLVLAFFNMLPAFPLDGGRVLRAVLWARHGDVLAATQTATRAGEVFGLALVALGVLSLFQGIRVGGAWQILIGAFILVAARKALEDRRIKTLLGDERVQDVMSSDVIIAHPDMTLAKLVNTVLLPNKVSFLPVVDRDRVLGHIDTSVLTMIDRDNWANTLVGDVFVSLDANRATRPDTLAIDALKGLLETGQRKSLVMDGNRLVGVVTMSDFGRLLKILSDLHQRSG